MPEWLKAIILGIVEGFTEFLPISSTGHLIVAERLFPLRDTLEGTFEIFIQLGAVIAVLLYYRAQLWQQVMTVHQQENIRQLWLSIILAFIPAAVIGLLFHKAIEAWLFSPEVVAIALIAGGLMFIGVERYLTATPDSDTSVEKKPLTVQQAIIVGIWQVLALIPGMSRSGMSIIGGMMAGLDRQRATQFSFYLAIPTLGSATVYTLVLDLHRISNQGLWLLFLGTVVSGIMAWFSIDWLLRYIARNSFIPFGYYRIIFGFVILGVHFLTRG